MLYRSQNYTFYADFFATSAKTDPLNPYNSSYPLYGIYDISGMEIQAGTATPNPNPGYYSVAFTPDVAAALSTEQQSWYIKWIFVTNDGRQVTYIERFDVVDEVTLETATTAQQVIGIANKITRTFLEVSVIPFDINLNVYQVNNYTTPIVENKTFPGAVKRVRNSQTGGFVYYYNIPANTLASNTEYLAVWDISETAASAPDSVIQKLHVVYFPVLAKIAQVRMLIDKVQKKEGTLHGYEDADIIEYLSQGLKLVNSIFPLTSYSPVTCPDALDFFWTIAAAWYGLNAQFMLEADTTFSFSGQTVTLDADRTGFIESELARLWDLINEHLPKLKIKLIRKVSLGTVSVRPYAGCNLVVAQPLLSSIERMFGFSLSSWFSSPWAK